MKLFTIGDSISQGFMSAAAARPDLCYSTLLADMLGMKPGIAPDDAYPYAEWPLGGHPINFEILLRRLAADFGSDIGGPFEWTAAVTRIHQELDKVEDYYERGPGSHRRPYTNSLGNDGFRFFPNVSVRGFDITDSWQVTPNLCFEAIAKNRRTNRDNWLHRQIPSESFYRTALRVLNPSMDKAFDDFSQMDWLEAHASGEGIDNTIVWLGANNALASLTKLKINQTSIDGSAKPASKTHFEKRDEKWNLWHPSDFKYDYEELASRLSRVMSKNKAEDWKVFIGTIPLITICPLAKGVGPVQYFEGEGNYYKYYTWFPFEESFAQEGGPHLTMNDARHIDRCIRAYNEIIKATVDGLNRNLEKSRYFVVDIASHLNDLAWKRNSGNPPYQFPDYFDYIYPNVNTRYYHADQFGILKQGGIFSLDGVHPSAIGQGLIAWEFQKVMAKVGVKFEKDHPVWKDIFESDDLYQRPIPIMRELYQHRNLADFFAEAISRLIHDD